uniref:Hemicentin-2 n=1 Tax=Aceria tosichella TaxID=561515 RepID=A0A6G1SDF4_9ACAR
MRKSLVIATQPGPVGFILLFFLLSLLGQTVVGQQNGPPKILPIATADSYPEGSSINLICTVSGGQRRGLTLSWTFNGEPIDGGELNRQLARGYGNTDAASGTSNNNNLNNVAINMDDADISILKIKNATLNNSGQYTCTAKNPLGEDSTSVNIVINVELKWVRTPKDKVELGLGQQVSLECDAIGSPQPIIEWFKHSQADRAGREGDSPASANDTHLMAKGKLFKIQRAQHSDSGLYECHARNGAGPELRRFIQVIVRGKY